MMQKRASSLGKFLVGIAASLEGSQAGYTKVTDKYVSVAASILRTAALPRIVNSLNNRTDRAVVFVDPFGMQLDWSTVQAVAAKPIVDFWYLVPIGIAVNRLATKNADRMSEAWGKRLDAFLGTSTWRTEWYAPSPQPDFFVTAPTMERQVNIDKIEEFFHKRLGEAFHRVAPNKLQLGSSRSKPLYTLMFACSNPSDRAFGAALRIANHLLKS